MQLLHSSQSSMICPLWHFYGNAMGNGPLHSKEKIRVFLLQEVSVALYVDLLGASGYGHYTPQIQESLLNSGATNKASGNG